MDGLTTQPYQVPYLARNLNDVAGDLLALLACTTSGTAPTGPDDLSLSLHAWSSCTHMLPLRTSSHTATLAKRQHAQNVAQHTHAVERCKSSTIYDQTTDVKQAAAVSALCSRKQLLTQQVLYSSRGCYTCAASGLMSPQLP